MTAAELLQAAATRAETLGPLAAALTPACHATVGPGAVWADPDATRVWVTADRPGDRVRLKRACLKAGVPAGWLRGGTPPAEAVKVAAANPLRYLTDALQFTRGRGPGGSGLPTAPSPLASALAGALLLGGGGWVAGRAMRAAAPNGYGEKLPATLAAAGTAAGATPGLLWRLGQRDGDGWADPWPAAKTGESGRPDPGSPYAGVYLPGLEKLVDAPGADPLHAAAVAGATLAAARMPGEPADGFVSAAQFGRLGLAAAGDYAGGLAVGAALNALVGTPHRPPAFGVTAAALGLAGRVVGGLF